jgi:hypothetical protein
LLVRRGYRAFNLRPEIRAELGGHVQQQICVLALTKNFDGITAGVASGVVPDYPFLSTEYSLLPKPQRPRSVL